MVHPPWIAYAVAACFLLAPLLVIIGGLCSLIWPRTMWYLSEGWKFRGAEPSGCALVVTRLGGVFAIVGGLVFFAIVLMASVKPAGAPTAAQLAAPAPRRNEEVLDRMLARVQLFAVARQRAGRSTVEVDLPAGATVSDLKAAIARDVPDLAPLLDSSRFAVDAEYADDATPIPPGAALALIPPVSGGSGSPSPR